MLTNSNYRLLNSNYIVNFDSIRFDQSTGWFSPVVRALSQPQHFDIRIFVVKSRVCRRFMRRGWSTLWDAILTRGVCVSAG